MDPVGYSLIVISFALVALVREASESRKARRARRI
jgi:hypothetical protein